MARIGGVVLCGGRSRRMGTPKEWLPFGDEVLLQRVVHIVRLVVSPVVVVSEALRSVPDLPADVRVVRDEQAYRGPLQGLANGLMALTEVDAVYLSACDAPLLRSTFVQRMIDHLGSADVVLPEMGGFKHPLAGVYRRNVLPTLVQMLAEDRLRLTDVLTMHRTVVMSPDTWSDIDPASESLLNCNDPASYQELLQRFTNTTSTA